ncbi:MAG: hypothetical protein AABY32_06385 [Nanoarchaeota archaeon]
MTNRKKRLKKGINSLSEQISLHEDKKRIAEKDKKEELVEYYKKEIESKQEALERKQKMLDKKK